MNKRTLQEQLIWEKEQIDKFIKTGKVTIIPSPKNTIKEDGQTLHTAYFIGR